MDNKQQLETTQATSLSQNSIKKPITNNTTLPKDPRASNSTQNSLLIDNIRENMVVTKDGGFRGVITCKSINFDLVSTVEQDAIENSYQMFLNSLYFPIQIFIRSQRVDIEPYVEYLTGIQAKNDNLLLNNLMDDYISFIYNLSDNVNIMDKSFFIVVEFSPFGETDSNTISTKNLFDSLFISNTAKPVNISADGYQKSKTEIDNRCNAIISGLQQIGINSVRLNTQELSTLYYNFYNPDTAINQPIGDFQNYINMFIDKGEKKTAETEVKNV